MADVWLLTYQLYEKTALWFNIGFLICGAIAGIRLYRYLKGKEPWWSRLWSSLDTFWSWLPGDDPIKEREVAKEEHKRFLERRRNRKPGNLTDEM